MTLLFVHPSYYFPKKYYLFAYCQPCLLTSLPTIGHMSKGGYEFEYIMNSVLWVYLTLLLPRRMLEDEQDDDDVLLVLTGITTVVLQNTLSIISSQMVFLCFMGWFFLFFQVVFMKCCYVLCRAHTQEIIVENLRQALCTH